jgi:hypothetical protein
MRCFGFIRDELLQQEAALYGDAGERAQVIWPNAALAATAVGMAMSMLLPWHSRLPIAPYLVYDGNTLEISPSSRLQHLNGVPCRHYSPSQRTGDLAFTPNY